MSYRNMDLKEGPKQSWWDKMVSSIVRRQRAAATKPETIPEPELPGEPALLSAADMAAISAENNPWSKLESKIKHAGKDGKRTYLAYRHEIVGHEKRLERLDYKVIDLFADSTMVTISWEHIKP